MIRQDIYLKTWDWRCRIYYAIDTYYVDEIVQDLISIGCEGEDLESAKRNLIDGALNTGLTYTSPRDRASIVVIAQTSTAEEFQNSYDHEKGHLAKQISRCLRLDPYGEETQYLAGAIGQATFKVAKTFLCDRCRRKLLN